ncbi:MAG: lipase family protein [Verrucomicrobia bacterium]|nr:lipase family protein [Verrucomicrobiota bacterium]
MKPLSPDVTAEIAIRVYVLQTMSVSEAQRKRSLGCEGQFKVVDDSRFTGKSGGYVFRQLSGFGYMAEGEGTRQGEILVATRGTNSFHDKWTDAHTGLRRGPSGLPVHIGFQRVWESYAEELKAFLRGKNPTHIHCVGHSLGGGLAMLNADFFAANKLPVSLYTFGCPRVGLSSFSQGLTRGVGADNIYRVSHDTDPVTMVPSFPFIHAPYGGKHYTLARGGMIGMGAHSMLNYVNSVTGKSWSSLANAQVSIDWTDAVARIWLDAVKAGNGGIMMYSGASLEVIAQALRWIIRKAISLGIVFPASNTLGGGLTAVDLLATVVTQSARLSKELADDVKTIMAAILRFLGRTAATTAELTHQFIHWVFDLLYGSISSMANRATMGDGEQH